MMKLSFRYSNGNALAEYALPIALIVVTSGAIVAFMNVNKVIPKFMAKASGGSVAGQQITAPSMGNGAGGGVGTGGLAGNNTFVTSAGGGIGGAAHATDIVGGDGNGYIMAALATAPSLPGSVGGASNQQGAYVGNRQNNGQASNVVTQQTVNGSGSTSGARNALLATGTASKVNETDTRGVNWAGGISVATLADNANKIVANAQFYSQAEVQAANTVIGCAGQAGGGGAGCASAANSVQSSISQNNQLSKALGANWDALLGTGAVNPNEETTFVFTEEGIMEKELTAYILANPTPAPVTGSFSGLNSIFLGFGWGSFSLPVAAPLTTTTNAQGNTVTSTATGANINATSGTITVQGTGTSNTATVATNAGTTTQSGTAVTAAQGAASTDNPAPGNTGNTGTSSMGVVGP